MLHGKGAGNYRAGSQSFLTEKYEEKRQRGMENYLNLTSAERLKYEISGSQGRGRTNDDTYQFDQFPFPTDQSIRKRQKIDMRLVDPTIGGD